MKKKVDKETKSMTFMVTKLVAVSGCSLKKAKEIAEAVTTPNSETMEYYDNRNIFVSYVTETIIQVEKKA